LLVEWQDNGGLVLNRLPKFGGSFRDRILAIEAEAFMDGARASRENAASLAEARATPPTLDVERLTRLAMAIDCGYYPGSTDADRAENRWADGVTVNCCDEHRAIATEYARLSASGESPEPSGVSKGDDL
jgi:hypothetical protein